MEKLNIAELLKDCPKGMELDCTIYDGVVTFEGVNDCAYYPIKISIKNGDESFSHTLTKYGQTYRTSYNKCIIYPKCKTTWEGFQRPFKDGDVLAYQCPSYTNPSIYIHKYSQNLNTAFYVALGGDGTFRVGNKFIKALYGNDSSARFATEEEKQKLFDAIKANGYKWNPETKTLEKLIKPKFKVGDRIKAICNNFQYDIKELTDTHYTLVEVEEKFKYTEPISEDKNWELVPNKFDITTLMPFESRVLVRGSNDDIWKPAIWGIYNDIYCSAYPYITTYGATRQCIPYEDNQHLLGTTNDCDDFYKTWE